jgi:hypothetical protein
LMKGLRKSKSGRRTSRRRHRGGGRGAKGAPVTTSFGPFVPAPQDIALIQKLNLDKVRAGQQATKHTTMQGGRRRRGTISNRRGGLLVGGMCGRSRCGSRCGCDSGCGCRKRGMKGGSAPGPARLLWGDVYDSVTEVASAAVGSPVGQRVQNVPQWLRSRTNLLPTWLPGAEN